MLNVVLAAVVLSAPWSDALENGARPKALRLAREALQDSNASVKRSARLTEIAALVELRRYDELIPAVEAALEEEIVLGPYAKHLLSVANAARGACDTAESHAAALPQDSIFRSTSWSRVAYCALRKKQHEIAESAVDAYDRSSAADWQKAEANLLRGRLLELRGEKAQARDLFRQVRIRHPFTQAAVQAKAKLEALSAKGLKSPAPTGIELLPKAQAERARLRKRAARRTYLQVLRSGTRNRDEKSLGEAQLGLAELEVIDYRYPRALKRLEELVAKTTDPEIRAHALYLQGDIRSRKGWLEPALESFQRAIDDHPATAYALESALAGARLTYSKRQLERSSSFARWLYEQDTQLASDARIITEDGATKHAYATQGHHQDEAAWILAWIEKRRGSQPAQVEEWLSRISDRTPVGLGARYWLARFSRDRGDLEAAQTLSTQVTALAPRHFYALAARDLICEAGGPCASTLEPVSAERPKHTARDLIAAVQFFDVGLEDTAHRLVERLPYRGLAPVDRAYFAWLHSRRNETRTAARVTRSLEGEADLLSDRSVLNAGYPTVFEDIVEREATRSGVPSALLLAVMREESGFDPGALSPRGARGLMQMIPRTARRMARSAGLRGFRLGKLFSPETSIRLGAHYLRLLLDEFDGDLPAAVASYHAGEKTVARWKAASPSTSSDEFIEEIPYSSTRAYVKRVLGTYGTYRELSLTSEGQAQTSEPVLKLSHAERAPQQG